jgi:hypothetical protein
MSATAMCIEGAVSPAVDGSTCLTSACPPLSWQPVAIGTGSGLLDLRTVVYKVILAVAFTCCVGAYIAWQLLNFGKLGKLMKKHGLPEHVDDKTRWQHARDQYGYSPYAQGLTAVEAVFSTIFALVMVLVASFA